MRPNNNVYVNNFVHHLAFRLRIKEKFDNPTRDRNSITNSTSHETQNTRQMILAEINKYDIKAAFPYENYHGTITM